MGEKGHSKRCFAGANTSKGFVSLYDHIIDPFDSKKLIIKGGPGLGKSTFMRQIGDTMLDNGYDVEFFHCSSDPGSLDGVVIPKLKVAVIDGTSPHIVDPKYPGAVDEILNFGEYWNESALRKQKNEIIRLSCETSRHFARTYRLLKAASEIHQDWKDANVLALDVAQANKICETLIEDIFKGCDISQTPGKQRHLFATAISPDGFISHVDSITSLCSRKYVLEGEPGCGKSSLISTILTFATKYGYDTEVFHCALNPDSIEHLTIPELGVALITSHDPHIFTIEKNDTLVNMAQCLRENVTRVYLETIEYDRRMIKKLLDRATSTLRSAIVAHDGLEDLYTPNIDFSSISKLATKTIDRILGFAGEKQD